MWLAYQSRQQKTEALRPRDSRTMNPVFDPICSCPSVSLLHTRFLCNASKAVPYIQMDYTSQKMLRHVLPQSRKIPLPLPLLTSDFCTSSLPPFHITGESTDQQKVVESDTKSAGVLVVDVFLRLRILELWDDVLQHLRWESRKS